MEKNIFIQKKEVMWSALNDGFSIDVNNRGLFALYMQDMFEHGFKSRAIIMIDGEEYEVRLSNKMFDPQKFEHADQFFVNYGRQSGFAKKMRSIFFS